MCGPVGTVAAYPRCGARLLWQPVGGDLAGDYGGCVYFAVAARGNTGVVLGAVFVEAEGTVGAERENGAKNGRSRVRSISAPSGIRIFRPSGSYLTKRTF